MQARKWILTGGTVLALGLAANLSLAQNDAGPQNAGACQGLTRLSGAALADPTAVVEQADLRAASTGGPAPGAPAGGRGGPPIGPMPAHCEILGKMQEHAGPNGQTYAIRFHLRLPTAWNGRFFFQGGGGTDGNIGAATGALLGAQTDSALNMGYAVVTTDSGHDNSRNNDPKLQGTATFGWDEQARRNYGFASIGPVTKTAKALIKAFYGRAPSYSRAGTNWPGRTRLLCPWPEQPRYVSGDSEKASSFACKKV